MNNASVIQLNVDYAKEKGIIKDYLESEPEVWQIPANKAILINLDSVEKFNLDLCNQIEGNTKRFTGLFCEVIDKLLPEQEFIPTDESTALQVLLYQRTRRNEQIRQEPSGNYDNVATAPENMFPPTLTRNYTMTFKPRSLAKEISVRQIKGDCIGKMISVKGIVTRVSNVKPLAVVAAYSCDSCGNEVFQDITSQNWMPVDACPSPQCKQNRQKGKLHLQTRGCKFLKFQELKLQELTEQVPMGHIPRSMTVYLTEAQTRTAIPGEIIVVSGVMLPIPVMGFKALRAGLITDTYLEAHHVHQLKKQYSDMELTPEIDAEISSLVQQPGLYDRLAFSIAPEIFGHEDVKKALMLMLVGGTTKETADGMKVRGDLNMCLMGDPGVAKSQLLKHICKIAPRAVYTTGRGSSGVGLTASVTRDPVTEEMVLEGGALVLADNGIACIDEFDKMDETDRTAIHEVMEQQTISISKAGITTTLNARTSILAAANPQYGRYNIHMKATENINLPAALLSRFDLLFLLLDKPSLETDLRLAQHVTYVHRCGRHPKDETQDEPLEPALMKNYICRARRYNPTVPKHVGDYIVNAYVHMRARSDETSELQYTSARTLLSIIRLASALARLRFASSIEISDVDEALRLIDVSKASVSIKSDKSKKVDAVTAIFHLIRDMSTTANGGMLPQISISEVRERVVNKGHTEKELNECLEAYQNDSVWIKTNDDHLRWLSIEEGDDEMA